MDRDTKPPMDAISARISAKKAPANSEEVYALDNYLDDMIRGIKGKCNAAQTHILDPDADAEESIFNTEIGFAEEMLIEVMEGHVEEWIS